MNKIQAAFQAGVAVGVWQAFSRPLAYALQYRASCLREALLLRGQGWGQNRRAHYLGVARGLRAA